MLCATTFAVAINIKQVKATETGVLDMSVSCEIGWRPYFRRFGRCAKSAASLSLGHRFGGRQRVRLVANLLPHFREEDNWLAILYGRDHE